MELYRRRQNECTPRFNQSFSGLCEQNLQDTQQLKQRFLDAKNKRAPKSKDKKQQDTIQSNVHVHQKFLKRPSDEHDPGGPQPDAFEPPVKLQCTGTHQPEGLTKFSVEIVQQLEFTTSAANSQPQQISTNVTVKAHTNASVKSDVSSPKSNPSTPASKANAGCVDVGTLVECVKQEPDNDFADLDQCAAALEKDAAANGGAGFGGFTDLIGDDTNDEIITSDAFKDLISDISNYPEFMKDFDFEEKTDSAGVVNGMKVEEMKEMPQAVVDNRDNIKQSPLMNQNYSPPVFENQMSKSRMGYSNMDFTTKTELSPAAQTLKQMAEQHQHKNQMGLSFNPNNRSHARSPYSEFQYGEYGSPNSSAPGFHKNSPSFPQPDMIKQEMIFQGNEFDVKRKNAGMYKQQQQQQQQYSPYGSPNAASSHGSPGYLPRGTAASSGGNGGGFGGGASPRPPSGSGGSGSGATLQISQAQQLHFTQQGHGHNIQVSAGQHLHLSGDIKGNVSIAAHQGMHFTQHSNGQTNQSTSQNTSHQQNPLSGNQQQHPTGMPPQQQQQQQQNTSNQQHNPMGQQPPSQNQQMPAGMNPQHHNMQHNLHQGQMGGMANAGGNGNVMTGMHHGGIPGNMSVPDSYSMSQTQTINFTQQTLRQRANGPVVNPTAMNNMGQNMGPMGATTQMGPRHMAPQTMEQKLFQQQQLLRAQAMQQQHLVRPPPPEYKSVSGMMQGMQPRFAGAPAPMRRMPQQPMPPSGPMIRPHSMYVMQQQHMNTRNMYPRQQAPIANLEAMPQHGSNEWRHLLMTQQQNANFSNHMRPNFQHQAFNLNTGGMQMTALQHQQLRNQQNMTSNLGAQQGMNQVMNQSGPMAQMNNMNQQMLHLQQQQQNVLQQNSTQISNMHLQQSQSLSVTNMHQQQSNMNTNSQLMSNPSNNNNNQSNAVSNFNSQADFGLEFLESLPAADSGFDQELLSSFDSDSGFNIDF